LNKRRARQPDRFGCSENEQDELIRKAYERYKNFSWRFLEALAENPIFMLK